MPGENGALTYRNRYVRHEPGFKAPNPAKSGGVRAIILSQGPWSSREFSRSSRKFSRSSQECSRSSQDILASNWYSLATGLMSGLCRALGLGVGARWMD
jgi:hypothetical protein